METKDKTLLHVGDKIYLQQQTGNSWVDMVKRPHTVIAVRSNKVLVQECNLIFDPEDNYYDSYPTKIEADLNGNVKELTWHPKKGLWGTKGRESDYPEYAHVSKEYEYEPYLN